MQWRTTKLFSLFCLRAVAEVAALRCYLPSASLGNAVATAYVSTWAPDPVVMARQKMYEAPQNCAVF